MAVTLRFRPVLYGPPERPTSVFYLVEEPSGQVLFRELEFSWPVAAPLEAVTRADLPSSYGRDDLELSILPPQSVEGATLAEAHQRMTDALEALSAEGSPGGSGSRGAARATTRERSA
jgi:hypothetical protein